MSPMGGKQTRVSTPITMGAMLPILRSAFRKKTGSEMAAAEPYLLAMLALENGNGSAISNHNWGNVSRWKPEQDYFFIGKNPREFRSLASHEQGAENFVSTLFTPTNVRIVEAALDDDFEGFFEGIHSLNSDTRKAYNHLTDYDKLDSALKAYASLVSRFKNEPLDDVFISSPQRGKIKPTRKNSSNAGPTLLVIALLGASFFYVKSKISNGS